MTFYIVSWYTHRTNEYRKSFFRYFGSILKAFRVIGAVLEQIESLHKTELGTSREGRAFPVCLCSDFLLPLPVCTLRTERPSAWNTRPGPPEGASRTTPPEGGRKLMQRERQICPAVTALQAWAFCPHLDSCNASRKERYNYVVLVILTNTT